MTLEYAPQNAVPGSAAAAAAIGSAAAPTNLGRSLHDLGRALDGQLVLPGSDDYEARRQIHNLMAAATVWPATAPRTGW